MDEKEDNDLYTKDAIRVEQYTITSKDFAKLEYD